MSFPSNSTCPITAYTFTGTTPVNLGTGVLALDPITDPLHMLCGMCTNFQIQNQSGSDVLLLDSASATKGILILDQELYTIPPDNNGNGYDVFEFWVSNAAGSGDIVVFRHKA